MEQEDASLWCGFDIRNHALEIKTNRVLVVVPVLLDSQT
jgi:hypothetical protein